jgi:hypothetical protein
LTWRRQNLILTADLWFLTTDLTTDL